MPKITYHEYRPGRWVKLVDGRAVGPATAEEVAQWQREKAEQATIWQDVIQETATDVPARDRPAAGHGDEPTIWQDVVGQIEGPGTTPAAPDETKEPEPPPRTVGDALQSARRGKPVVVRYGRVVTGGRPVQAEGPHIPPAAQPPAAAERTEPEAQPAETPVRPARASPAKRAAKPKSIPPEETAELAAATAAGSTAVGAAPEPGRAVVAKEAARPEPAGETARAPKPKPAGRRAEPMAAAKAAQAEPTVTPEIDIVAPPAEPVEGPARAVPAREAAELPPVPEAETAQATAPAGRAPEPAEPAEGATEAKPMSVQAVLPDVEAEPEPVIEIVRSRKRIRPGRPATAAPRAREVGRTAPQDALSPAYLWIMAGPADDLLAAVRGGLARYEERFAERAGAVLCNVADLPALEGAQLAVDVRPRKGVPPGNFWIGPK